MLKKLVLVLSIWALRCPLLADSQSLTMSQRSDLRMRETLHVLTSCKIDRALSIAAPDTVRYVWGVDRVLREDWSCRYGVLGGATWLAVRLYRMPHGKLLCAFVEDRGRRKTIWYAPTVIPCEAFEPLPEQKE